MSEILDVLAGARRWCVVEGDALDVLREIGADHGAHVVCDPPYGINTKSDGMGKLSPWADLCNAATFYRDVFGECRRIVGRAGSLWSFLSWRTIATFQKASADLRWPIESVAVWHKDWIGPGGSRGLRPSYELIALWCGEEYGVPDRGVPDLVTVPWSSQKPNGHPAEKPVALIDWILATMAPASGSLIVDPFAGVGTVGVSAMRRGLRYIGVELDAAWAATARQRIAAEQAGSTLRAAQAGQVPMFGGGEP